MAKIVNEKYSMENIVKSSSQEVQIKVGKAYLHLKYFLFVGNLISASLKLPEFYKMIEFIIGLSEAKKNQPEEDNKSEPSIQMILNVAFLYLGFFLVIVNQICVSIKIIKKHYRSLITYFVLFAIYLLFMLTAYFADLQNSTMPLGLALYMTKISLFGVGVHFADITTIWWHMLLKTSFIIDIFLYIITIVFYVLITKLKSYTINRKILNDQSYSSVENV